MTTHTTPPIVTICGSMWFFPQMLEVAATETLAGNIVLAPFSIVATADQASEAKQRLDDLHLRKIDLAERVIVVTNQDGYMEESTQREMVYAMTHGKDVDIQEFTTEPVVIDGKRVIGAGHRIPA